VIAPVAATGSFAADLEFAELREGMVGISGSAELSAELLDGLLLGVAEPSERPLEIEELGPDGHPHVAIPEEMEALRDVHGATSLHALAAKKASAALCRCPPNPEGAQGVGQKGCPREGRLAQLTEVVGNVADPGTPGAPITPASASGAAS
jgi:hypothetical protein